MSKPFLSMPWYKALNNKLEAHQWAINTALVVIVAITIFLLVRGDRPSRLAWLVYLISP